MGLRDAEDGSGWGSTSSRAAPLPSLVRESQPWQTRVTRPPQTGATHSTSSDITSVTKNTRCGRHPVGSPTPWSDVGDVCNVRLNGTTTFFSIFALQLANGMAHCVIRDRLFSPSTAHVLYVSYPLPNWARRIRPKEGHSAPRHIVTTFSNWSVGSVPVPATLPQCHLIYSGDIHCSLPALTMPAPAAQAAFSSIEFRPTTNQKCTAAATMPTTNPTATSPT